MVLPWPRAVEITIGGSTTDWITALASLVVAFTALAALQQLSEVKRDRHVQVFAGLALQWQSAEMVEALTLEADYSPATLAELFSRLGDDPPTSDDEWDVEQDAQRKEEVRRRAILFRVPNYFEDALFMARAGGLDRDLFREYMSGVVLQKWPKWKPAVKEMQRVQDELAYVEFETFALEIIAREKARTAGASSASEAAGAA